MIVSVNDPETAAQIKARWKKRSRRVQAYAAKWNRQATFDARVRKLERVCRRDLPRVR